MTVTYTNEVANARLGSFLKLFLRRQGSFYKLLYKEFLIYATLYTVFSLVYRFALHGEQKERFEKLCLFFQHYTEPTSITWILGFYVVIVVGRWWSQLENLPFPDRLMMIIVPNVHGNDDRGRLLRRTMLRYLNLAQILTYRDVSTVVKKRFPTTRHIVEAGFMTEDELKRYENVKTENSKYWVPFMWLSNLLTETRQEGRIKDDMTFKLLLEELNMFRGCCARLIDYNWISVPLAFTQMVTVVVYMFFMSTLLSSQNLDVAKGYAGHEFDTYVPVFTIGQFFVYVGSLKVAEQLINPFGEDDDDFEVNFCIDRNHEVTMIVADQMYAKHPKLEKDKFWNNPSADNPYHNQVVCADDTDDDDRDFVEDPVSRVQNGNHFTPKEINVAARTRMRKIPEKLEGALSPQLLPNPSVNEVDGIENTTPIRLSNILEKPNLNEPTRGGACGPGTSPHDVTMSFNKNIRRPVQVVSSASPLKEICVILEEPHDPALVGNHGNNPPSTTIDVTSRKPGAQKGNHPAMQLKQKGAAAFVICDDEEYGETQTRIRRTVSGSGEERSVRSFVGRKTETRDVTKTSPSPVQKENQFRTAPKERKVKAEQKGTIKKIPEVRSPAPPPRPEHPDKSSKSLISSPSGNEGDGTDNFTTPISPLNIFDKPNLDQPTRSGVWGPGASPRDVTMPFTDGLRKLHQVVPSASPSAASSPGNHSNNLPKIVDTTGKLGAQKGNHLVVKIKQKGATFVSSDDKEDSKILPTTVSRSEKRRSGVPYGGDKRMPGTGEFTCETEVKYKLPVPQKNRSVSRSSRPNTLGVKSLVGRKTVDRDVGKNTEELELDELVLEADKKDTQPSEEAKFLTTSELDREEETSLIQIAIDEPDDEESLDSNTPVLVLS